MKHRKLRIAWSVAWGIAAVLLVVLWVRSYWRLDGATFGFTTKKGTVIVSQFGIFGVSYRDYTGTPATFSNHFSSSPIPDTVVTPPGAGLLSSFVVRSDLLGIPYWLLVLSVVTCGITPWANTQSSLRKLPVVMAVSAVGLGLVALLLKRI